MHKLSKAKLDYRFAEERNFVEELCNRLDLLAGHIIDEDRQSGKSKNKCANEYTKKHVKVRRVENLKDEIRLSLESVYISPHRVNKQLALATREESWLIRLDWDGNYKKPYDDDYSPTYAKYRQLNREYRHLNTEDEVVQGYDASDYRLDRSPAWRFMRKFPNYAANKKRICMQLAARNIPPSAVAKMNFFDFSDILYSWAREHQIKPFESARSRNFKMFEACYGDEFEKIMKLLHYKPEYIATLRDKMQHGSCDALFSFHHKTNVARFRELDEPEKINDFSNMLLAPTYPHHRVLHFENGYDVKEDIVFMGGFDPLFQIKRDPEREREYLLSQQKSVKVKKSGKSSR